jgi:hypothetical protein
MCKTDATYVPTGRIAALLIKRYKGYEFLKPNNKWTQYGSQSGGCHMRMWV